MRIWAEERRWGRRARGWASSGGEVLRGWCNGVEEWSWSRWGKPDCWARASHLRTVFSQTPKAAAVARRERPRAACWRTIWARVSGVSLALACMLSVGDGGRLRVD